MSAVTNPLVVAAYMFEDIDSLLRPLTTTTHLPLLEPIRPPAGRWNHAIQLMYFRRLPSACHLSVPQRDWTSMEYVIHPA
ncbi:uncharacterized protein LMH87_007594 [Akanthomyces muscarius]|uniref:Uncharacterized protein n=1 Tax=Akanthomyces muscarius TaxID=2231603 RepID=A0A9W8UPY7_AKAMU|nr:uncharacterized protein LMH87_007594 [Akanthomyces muscarius]KAJ4161562.1 hypothetical protein LMH87_007594 [Akanthomyces muscarius]